MGRLIQLPPHREGVLIALSMEWTTPACYLLPLFSMTVTAYYSVVLIEKITPFIEVSIAERS